MNVTLRIMAIIPNSAIYNHLYNSKKDNNSQKEKEQGKKRAATLEPNFKDVLNETRENIK